MFLLELNQHIELILKKDPETKVVVIGKRSARDWKERVFAMGDIIKSINFIKFDLLDTTVDNVALNCNLEFAAQVPKEETKLEKAVLITFKATTETDVMHLEIQARVIFDFQEVASMPDDEKFLDEYYQEAYRIFKEKIDVVVAGLEKGNLRLPETV